MFLLECTTLDQFICGEKYAVVSTAHWSDEDLGATIAYLKTIPPINHQLKERYFAPLAKMALLSPIPR